MTAAMTAQEASDTIRALTDQIVQISSALDTANAKIITLQQTCDGAWKGTDNRMGAAEVKITHHMDQASRGGNKHPMKLVNESAIAPTVFSNDRREWTSWSRTMKAYLDCRYSGFRRMLEWAETREDEILLEHVDSTQWTHARESNGQLYNFLLTVTKLEAQAMVNNMDPTMGYECWRKIAQFYDPP